LCLQSKKSNEKKIFLIDLSPTSFKIILLNIVVKVDKGVPKAEKVQENVSKN